MSHKTVHIVRTEKIEQSYNKNPNISFRCLCGGKSVTRKKNLMRIRTIVFFILSNQSFHFLPFFSIFTFFLSIVGTHKFNSISFFNTEIVFPIHVDLFHKIFASISRTHLVDR